MSHHGGTEVMGRRGGHPYAAASPRGSVAHGGDELGGSRGMLWGGCFGPGVPHIHFSPTPNSLGGVGRRVLHLGFGKDL